MAQNCLPADSVRVFKHYLLSVLQRDPRVSLVQSLSPHHARHVPHGGEQRGDATVHNVTLVHGNILEGEGRRGIAIAGRMSRRFVFVVPCAVHVRQGRCWCLVLNSWVQTAKLCFFFVELDCHLCGHVMLDTCRSCYARAAEPVLEAVTGEGPYDAVVVGAAARSVPQGLVELLRPGGRLVVAVGRPLQMQVHGDWVIVQMGSRERWTYSIWSYGKLWPEPREVHMRSCRRQQGGTWGGPQDVGWASINECHAAHCGDKTRPSRLRVSGSPGALPHGQQYLEACLRQGSSLPVCHRPAPPAQPSTRTAVHQQDFSIRATLPSACLPQELLVVDKGADGGVTSCKARDVHLPPLAPALADRFQL